MIQDFRKLAALLVCAPALCLAQAGAYTIKTYAGTGAYDFTGDSGQASAATFKNPFHIALDKSGVMYVADQNNSRIRKIDANGVITTIAGKESSGYDSKATTATSAALYYPCGVMMDSSGNVFIADTHSHVVRKVTTAGAISTVAGTSMLGYTTGTDSKELKAVDAQLYKPSSIAFDSAGNLFIADTFNSVIRKVDSSGLITTFAGTGTAGYTGDGGLATLAKLNYPQAITFDNAGNLFIADTVNSVIRKVDKNGVITTVAGNGFTDFYGDGGLATRAALNNPRGIAIDAAGNLFIADTVNNRVRVVNAAGVINTIAGNSLYGDSGDNGPATRAQLRFPTGIAVDTAGKVYFVDNGNNKIKLLTPTSGGTGTLPAIGAGSVITSASFGAYGNIAPGTWIEIYGANLASTTREWTAADFVDGKAPTWLEGTTVTIGGQPAYLSYVSPTQVNAQVPNVGAGPQQITVSTSAGASNSYPVTVNVIAPGILAPSSFNLNSRQYAVAIAASDSAYILPPGSISGIAQRPARPGETITFYGIGFGAVSPHVDPGTPAPSLNAVHQTVRVYFGSTEAQVTYAGLAPGSIGLYQFNVVVPDVPNSDAVQLTFSQGGINLPLGYFTAVRN